MNSLEFSLLVWLGGVAAGFLGSLTGLGGGIVIVPLLALWFGVDIRYAIGASFVSVIATSSGAAAAYVKEGYTNFRIGMFLEIATTIGAMVGAFLAARVSPPRSRSSSGSFSSTRRPVEPPRRNGPEAAAPDPLATFLKMDSELSDGQTVRDPTVCAKSRAVSA